MGNRSQIAIKQPSWSNNCNGDKMVWLYSHSDGARLFDALKTALSRGQSRWDDPEYLARIIVCDMVRDDLDGLLGYGIGVAMHTDVEHHIPVLDCRKKMISWIEAPVGSGRVPLPEPISFEDFVNE